LIGTVSFFGFKIARRLRIRSSVQSFKIGIASSFVFESYGYIAFLSVGIHFIVGSDIELNEFKSSLFSLEPVKIFLLIFQASTIWLDS